MKSTELRIGNLTDWGKVVQIEENHFYVVDNEGICAKSTACDIKPIPLTEEILVKAGFEYYSENNSFQYNSEYGFKIWGRIGKTLNLYGEVNDELGIDINFLHELQNLFFCLTGNELTINL